MRPEVGGKRLEPKVKGEDKGKVEAEVKVKEIHMVLQLMRG